MPKPVLNLKMSDALFVSLFLAAVCGVFALGTRIPQSGPADARLKSISMSSVSPLLSMPLKTDLPPWIEPATGAADRSAPADEIDYSFEFPAPAHPSQHNEQVREGR